jgi:formylglycine-generating enzyme required for sulfatase activity
MNAYVRQLPPCFPEPWASGWGQDRRGLWQSFSVKGVVQVLRWIPPGDFMMGSPADEPERLTYGDETRHRVVLTQGYWLADTACTQALWQAVLGEDPSRFKGAERPVERVSWTDVVERFLPALNALVPGLEASLPTEAQWELACRAGTDTPFSFGSTITTDLVNYDGNYPYGDGAKGEYRAQTVEVKALPASAWGLYQMHGNVWDWCADWLGDYPADAVVDPLGPPEGRERVLRGGGWFALAWNCRSADRGGYGPASRNGGIGLRLSRGSSLRPAGGVGVAGVVAGGRAPATAPDAPAPGRPAVA